MSSHRSMREAGVRGSLAAQSERRLKLSQELSQNSRPRRESDGHVGNENPHNVVVSLPHVVVWLAFKSLVSTMRTSLKYSHQDTGAGKGPKPQVGHRRAEGRTSRCVVSIAVSIDARRSQH